MDDNQKMNQDEKVSFFRRRWNQWKNFQTWKKVVVSIACVLLIVLVSGGALIWAKFSHLNYQKLSKEDVKTQDEEFDTDEDTSGLEQMDPNEIYWMKKSDSITKVDGVVNILLIGEENKDSDERGRTDAIMIATINTNDNSLKLTSILRDTYVQIPGYRDNRINSAYRTGDYPLLMETIEENFNIACDAYVKVDYDGFEGIIDELGGVEITLTEQEARYLNTTNYISKKSNRNVVAGTQLLNGNQALGFSRIRYIKTGDNQIYDYGRTSRQRTVLTAIFEKYKESSLADLVGLMDDVLDLVTTDLTMTDLMSYAVTILSMDIDELQTLRIPVDNSFSEANIRDMAVLVPDLQMNIDALHSFIFGSSYVGSNTSISTGSAITAH